MRFSLNINCFLGVTLFHSCFSDFLLIIPAFGQNISRDVERKNRDAFFLLLQMCLILIYRCYTKARQVLLFKGVCESLIMIKEHISLDDIVCEKNIRID